MDGRLATIDSIKADQGVDLEVGKVEIYVDRVQTDEEVDEGVLLFGGDVGEERRCDGGARGERRIDGDVELESFSIDIADVYTTFVREEDRVAFASRVNANVVLRVGRVRKERLDDEVVEGTSDSLNLGKERKKSRLVEGNNAWQSRWKRKLLSGHVVIRERVSGVCLPSNACCFPTNTFAL